jgi:hypothetical protein
MVDAVDGQLGPLDRELRALARRQGLSDLLCEVGVIDLA